MAGGGKGGPSKKINGAGRQSAPGKSAKGHVKKNRLYRKSKAAAKAGKAGKAKRLAQRASRVHNRSKN